LRLHGLQVSVAFQAAVAVALHNQRALIQRLFSIADSDLGYSIFIVLASGTHHRCTTESAKRAV